MLRAGALVALAAGVGAGTVQALAGGSWDTVVRWGTGAVALFGLVAGVLTALHALSGASRAQQRGQRLAGDDVGLVPRRSDSTDDSADG